MVGVHNSENDLGVDQCGIEKQCCADLYFEVTKNKCEP